MLFSTTDDLEKTVSDVINVEGTMIAFTMVAMGFVLSAISSFNQTNIGLVQIGMGKLCEYVPIAPTFQFFIYMVIADTVSLSTGLFARLAAKEQIKPKRRLLDASVWFLILGLGFFAMAVTLLGRAFYYPPCSSHGT
jgi:4-amino-4-deoxy-L-arabinose transferase-like glycosyltransferase